MLETSIIHSNLQSFYAQKPPVVFPDDSDDEGNEGACETDPGQVVAYMHAPPSRFVTKGETALTPVVFPEDSDDDEEVEEMFEFVHSDWDSDDSWDDIGTA